MTPSRRRAVAIVLAAVRTESDFAGWLASVLADVAAQLGSSSAVTAGRPGSWEADLVEQLVKKTVGYDDSWLPPPPPGRLTDTRAQAIRDAADWGEMTQRQIAARFGVSRSTVADIAARRTWRHLEDWSRS